MRKLFFFSPLILSSLLMSGCFANSFSDELEEKKGNDVKKENEESKDKEQKEKAEKDRYKELEKPLDQVIQENELDTVNTLHPKEIKAKEHYEDPDEFAVYAADILYRFYTSQLTPEEYYKFLDTYGSETVRKELPSKTDALTILDSLQAMYKSQNVHGEDYEITEVLLGRLKNEGYFYRKLSTTKGEEYFITTIVKEENEWRYVEDGPSPPFEENLTTQESETTSTSVKSIDKKGKQE